jgi:3-oxoadipate enol-lactonase
MPWANLPDITLYYECRGAGRPILFLGGTGSDLRRPPTAFDRALAEDFSVLAFDQRGMGRSAKPDQPYTMAGYAEDAAALLDHMGWGRVAVLGYSFGGMVAQELALNHPERVERLVLMSTTSGGAGGASYPLHELAGLAPAERARRMVELGDTRRDAAWREANRRLYDALVEETLAGIVLGSDEPGHDQGARRQLEARRRHDTWERLPRLSLPAAVCAGEYDGIAPPGHQAALAQRIPGARFHRFQGGHLFFLQDARAHGVIRDALRPPDS